MKIWTVEPRKSACQGRNFLSTGLLGRLGAGFLRYDFAEQGFYLSYTWGPKEQRRFNRVIKVLATINNVMPRQLRQLPGLALMWDFHRRLNKGLPLR